MGFDSGGGGFEIYVMHSFGNLHNGFRVSMGFLPRHLVDFWTALDMAANEKKDCSTRSLYSRFEQATFKN